MTDLPGVFAGGSVLKPAQPLVRSVAAGKTLASLVTQYLAGEPIVDRLTKAPGNGASIGGLKVTTENGWFAARPSGIPGPANFAADDSIPLVAHAADTDGTIARVEFFGGETLLGEAASSGDPDRRARGLIRLVEATARTGDRELLTTVLGERVERHRADRDPVRRALLTALTDLDPNLLVPCLPLLHRLLTDNVQARDTSAATRDVLMVGWMDDEALHRTLTSGRGTFWSRSRQDYWVKGETSGNIQEVREVRLDCDGDTVLVVVDQHGPACHTGDRTCFDSDQLL